MLIPLFKKTSILESKYLQLPLLYFLTFAIPILLEGPQLLIGVLINFLLVISISQYKFKEILPALILPSFSVYIYGLLFTGATSFLPFLIPLIVTGNTIYVLIFKYFKNKYLDIVLASLLKTIFIFVSTYILVKTMGLPQIFLITMGINQLITALVGGFLAKTLLKATSLLKI
jgi:hypothetical protein